MPTIDLFTTVLPLAHKKSIAVALTRWLADRETSPRNVIVTFHQLEPHSTFSGGIALDALVAGDHRPHYALALCRIGPDRDDHFRAELARQLTTQLHTHGPVPFVYIEFRTTAPAQVYIARDGALTRADTP
ncbi:hypothetical protein [Nocardia aurantiaca]|uniref:Uncharacterized protein n=1 Tax=Nocardia aurantiaca TaxID=2675850 RepID=A0A6I3L4R1_9NOCA|nr:hypothetical protein [Nocardia aurantiaca]MTE15654.1 hypothetical protein [Nocardia aurantiaca]